MTGSLRAWWIARSLREKRLIVVMLGLFAMVIAWFGVLRPITVGIADAETAHRVAVERAARVEAGVALLRETKAPAADANGSLDQIVTSSAAEAGFVLDESTPVGANTMSITIGTARTPALFTWLASLEKSGLVVDAATIQPGPNRTISARITLRRPTR